MYTNNRFPSERSKRDWSKTRIQHKGLWSGTSGEATEGNNTAIIAKARFGWDREVNKQSLLGHIVKNKNKIIILMEKKYKKILML